MGEGDGDVGEDGGGVGEDRGDDDGPGGVPAPQEARGRGPPFFFFSLNLLPRWEKGFPSGPWLPWHGRGESPSEIGSISLSLSISAFLDSAPPPFLLYLEILNSDWGESFAQIFLIKLDFLLKKKSVNRLTGGPGESMARLPPWGTPLSPGPPGHRLALILRPKNHQYSKKNLRPFLSRLDSV